MVLCPPLHVGRLLAFAPEAALEELGFALVKVRNGDGAAAWVAGTRELTARAARNMVL